MRLIETAGEPPPEALIATRLAAIRVRDLLEIGREVRFAVIPPPGHVAVALCDRDGAVLSHLSATRALEIAAGARRG